MPNYGLVVSSRFNPYSFDELVKPFQMYGQAYKEAEGAYEQLEELSNIWNLRIDDASPDTRARYDSFMSELQEQADALSANGLTPEVKRNLLKLKGKYASDIAPLEELYNTRKENYKMQQQAYLNNPSLYFEKDFGTISMDEMAKNPNVTSKVVNGDTVRQEVANQVAGLAEALYSGDIEKIKNTIGGDFDNDYYAFVQKQGFSREAVDNTIRYVMGDTTAIPDPGLTSIIERVVKKAVPADWDASTSKEAKAHALQYAAEGLAAGYGKTQTSLTNNWREQYKVQNQYEIEQLRERNKAKNNPDQYLGYDMDNTTYWYDRKNKQWFTEDNNGIRYAVPTEIAKKLPYTGDTEVSDFAKTISMADNSKTLQGIHELGYSGGAYIVIDDSNDGKYIIGHDNEEISGRKTRKKSYLIDDETRRFNMNGISVADAILEPMDKKNWVDIPGYKEFKESNGERTIEDSAWDKIWEAVSEDGITNTDNFEIVRIKRNDAPGYEYRLFYKR